MTSSFNSSAVWDAYLSPNVDTSDEPFEWGNPDLESIKEYLFLTYLIISYLFLIQDAK